MWVGSVSLEIDSLEIEESHRNIQNGASQSDKTDKLEPNPRSSEENFFPGPGRHFSPSPEYLSLSLFLSFSLSGFGLNLAACYI